MERNHIILVAIVVSGNWLIFAGNTSWQEITAALLAGIGVAAAGKMLRNRTGHRQGGTFFWFRNMPGILWQALKDSWTVSAALIRHVVGKEELTGVFRRLPYHRMSDEPEDVERRVMATIATTLQPNSYVFGFNKERKEILIHQLVPTPDHPVAEKLYKKQ